MCVARVCGKVCVCGKGVWVNLESEGDDDAKQAEAARRGLDHLLVIDHLCSSWRLVVY